jgi:hypothetical protein
VTETEVPNELPVGCESHVTFIATIARLDKKVAAAYHRVANLCDAEDIRSLRGDYPLYGFRELRSRLGDIRLRSFRWP